MAQSYWPFDAVNTTETEYSQLFRRLQNSGVWGDPGDNANKLIADVGLSTILKPGYSFVRGHMYNNDADLAIVFEAGSAQPRIDALVLRLDPAANTIVPTIIKGTPAPSNPTIPTLTQTDAGIYDVLIATVAMAASTPVVAPADISDARRYMGHIFGVWTTATRPSAPRQGQPGYNDTTKKPELYTGTGWSDFAPSAITAAMISAGEQLKLSVGNSAKVGGHAVYVQATQPSGMATDDIWLY